MEAAVLLSRFAVPAPLIIADRRIREKAVPLGGTA
jgi:hypothetical protein